MILYTDHDFSPLIYGLFLACHSSQFLSLGLLLFDCCQGHRQVNHSSVVSSTCELGGFRYPQPTTAATRVRAAMKFYCLTQWVHLRLHHVCSGDSAITQASVVLQYYTLSRTTIKSLLAGW